MSNQRVVKKVRKEVRKQERHNTSIIDKQYELIKLKDDEIKRLHKVVKMQSKLLDKCDENTPWFVRLLDWPFVLFYKLAILKSRLYECC